MQPCSNYSTRSYGLPYKWSPTPKSKSQDSSPDSGVPPATVAKRRVMETHVHEVWMSKSCMDTISAGPGSSLRMQWLCFCKCWTQRLRGWLSSCKSCRASMRIGAWIPRTHITPRRRWQSSCCDSSDWKLETGVLWSKVTSQSSCMCEFWVQQQDFVSMYREERARERAINLGRPHRRKNKYTLAYMNTYTWTWAQLFRQFEFSSVPTAEICRIPSIKMQRKEKKKKDRSTEQPAHLTKSWTCWKKSSLASIRCLGPWGISRIPR